MPSVTTCARAYTASSWSEQAQRRVVEVVTSGMERNSDFQSCAHTCAFSQVLRSALRRMPSVTTCASAYTASSWLGQAKRRVVEVVTSGMERNSDFHSCAHTCAFSQVLRSALRRMPSVPTCTSAYTASSWSGQAQRRVAEVVTSGMERNSDFQSCAHTCAFSQVLRSALRRMPSVPTCASAYTASSWSGQAQRRDAEVVTSSMERNSDFQSCAHTCAFSQVLRSALRRMPSVTTSASAYTASSWSGQAQRRVAEVVTSGMERNSDFQSCAHTYVFSQVLRSALRRMPNVTTCARAYTASSWSGQAKRRVVEAVTSGMERNSDFHSCAHTCAFPQVLRSALRRMPSVTICASAYTASSWSGQAQRRVVEVVTSGMKRNSDFQSCAHTCAFSQVLRSALRRMPSVTTCASACTASSWSEQAKRRVVEVVTSGMERNSEFQPCAHTCAFSQVLRSALRRMPSVPTCASAYTASSWSGQAQRRVVEVATSGMESKSDFQPCTHTCAFSQVLRSALRRMPSVPTCASAYTASSWSGQAQRRVVEVATSGMERNSDFHSCAHTCAFSQVLRSAPRHMPSVTTCARAYTASSWSEQAQRRVVEVVTSGMERNSDFQSCAHTCAFSQVLRSALRRMPSVPTCASAYTASSWSGTSIQRRVVEVATSGMERNSDFHSCAHTCAFSQVLRSAPRHMPSVTTCARAYTASSWSEQAQRRVVEVVTSGMERNSDFQSCAHTCAFSQVLRSALAALAECDNLRQRLHSFFMVRTSQAQSCRSCHLRHGAQQRFPFVRAYLRFLTGFAQRAAAHAKRANLHQRLHSFFMVRASPAQRCRSCHLQHGAQQRFPVVRAYLRFLTGFAQRAATHAERDNFRQRLHSFFMVRASPAQSCRSCHVRHGAQQRFPVVRAYLRFLTGFAQRAAAHAERDNLRPRLHSFFMVRTSQAQSCRSCHLRHGAQQRFPFVCAYLRFPTGFAQRFAAHAERDNLRQRLHSFLHGQGKPSAEL